MYSGLSKPDSYGTRNISWSRQSAGLDSFSCVISQFGTEKSNMFRQNSELDRCRFGQSAL